MNFYSRCGAARNRHSSVLDIESIAAAYPHGRQCRFRDYALTDHAFREPDDPSDSGDYRYRGYVHILSDRLPLQQ